MKLCPVWLNSLIIWIRSLQKCIGNVFDRWEYLHRRRCFHNALIWYYVYLRTEHDAVLVLKLKNLLVSRVCCVAHAVLLNTGTREKWTSCCSHSRVVCVGDRCLPPTQTTRQAMNGHDEWRLPSNCGYLYRNGRMLVWPRVFQEVKVPRLHDNGTGWW